MYGRAFGTCLMYGEIIIYHTSATHVNNRGCFLGMKTLRTSYMPKAYPYIVA